MGSLQSTTIHAAHKIQLCPNRKQISYFRQAGGIRRFVWNWCLAEWQRAYRAGEKPTMYGVKKRFNAAKPEFCYEVTKFAAEYAVRALGDAYKNFWNPRMRAGYPRFKRKGKTPNSFVAATGAFCKVQGRKVWVPKLGWVKMREQLRFTGKLLRITISERAGRWYAAIAVETERPAVERKIQAFGGLDVGINPLAVESDGTRWENPKALDRLQKRKARWQRKLARRTKGRANWRKAKATVQRIEKRIADIRSNAHHQCSRAVVRKYAALGVESLNVSGMLRNRRLAKFLSDAGLGELSRQIGYKADWYGTTLYEVGRFFPSSKMCSKCGLVNADLTLSEKRWTCECGVVPRVQVH